MGQVEGSHPSQTKDTQVYLMTEQIRRPNGIQYLHNTEKLTQIFESFWT